MVVTPTRYDLSSGQMLRGTPTSGGLSDAALTVTGGWVWIVLQDGASPQIVQLDPTTLAVRAEHFLPLAGDETPATTPPVLSATVDGPLWVADGDELWSLNPSTGAVETEVNAGNEVDSLSTDPTGALLYTGGKSSVQGGMTVTEYDARNGRELDRSSQPDAVGGGTVAATYGGVWVSYRTGMAGPALELSSRNLSIISPIQRNGFGPFDQIMGVGSAVSDGTLWLTSALSLACVDPGTSDIWAAEEAELSNPVASAGRLYALSVADGVVVVTPPPACFASA
jgi:hypothetical protein